MDTSFDEDDLRGTIGVVVCDSASKFVAAANSKIVHAQDVLTVEALALKQGSLLAQSIGCNRVIINSDSTDVVKIMLNGGQSYGVAAAVFDDCYHLSRDFVKIQLNMFLVKVTLSLMN